MEEGKRLGREFLCGSSSSRSSNLMVLPSGFLIRACSTQREQEGHFYNHSLFLSVNVTHQVLEPWRIVRWARLKSGAGSVSVVAEGNHCLWLSTFYQMYCRSQKFTGYQRMQLFLFIKKKNAKRALYEVLALIHLSGSDKAAAATCLRGAMWQVWESGPMEIKQQQLNANKGRDKTLSWDWWMPWWQRSGRARSPEWPLFCELFSSAHRCEGRVIATKCQVTWQIPVFFSFSFTIYIKNILWDMQVLSRVCVLLKSYLIFCRVKHAWPCMLCLEQVQSGTLFFFFLTNPCLT